MEKKTIAKSIRMKPSIYEFINSHSGDGFNEKFETVVRRYSLDSKKLVEENRYLMLENGKLNEMIYEKRKLLDQLSNLENDLRTVFFQTKIDGIIETVKSVNDITKETVVKQLKLLLTDFYDIYINRKLEDISNVEWFLLEDVLNKLTENKKFGFYETIALEDIYNLELSLKDMVVSYGYIFNRITNIDFDLTKSLVYNISSFKGLDKKVKSSYVSLLLDYEMSAVYLNQKRNYELMKEKGLELGYLKRPLITHEIIIDETMQYTDDKGFLNKVLELMKYQRKCFSGSTFVIHATDDINKNLENNGDLLSQLFELTTNKFIGYTTGKSLTTLPVLIPQLNKNDCKLISTFSKGKNNERTFFVFDDKKRKIIMTSIINSFQKTYYKGGV